MWTSTTTTISIRTTTRTSTKPVLARATAGSTTRNTGETRLTLTNKQRISTAARLLAVLENPAVRAVRVASAAPENPEVRVALVAPGNPAVRVVRVALEKPAVPVVRVALVVPENLAVQAVQVAPAALENPVAPAVLENPAVPAALVKQVPAALVRQLAAALVNQVEVAEKEAQTRSVAISHRRAAVVVAPSLAAVGALLKPRAAEVAVA
jgi:hypothetical protein